MFITNLLNDNKPCWINRFGGSDIPLINFIIKENYTKIDEHLLSILKKYNGYFNVTNNNNDILNEITPLYIQSYLNSDYILLMEGSDSQIEMMKILNENNKLVNSFNYHYF